MWVEIITPVVSAAASGLISWAIAKVSARAEIKKLRETWAHEKETAIDAEFDQMASSVSAYLMYKSLANAIEAAQTITTYRAKATADLAASVDSLSELFEHPEQNQQRIKQALDKIIELKRPKNRQKDTGKN